MTAIRLLFMLALALALCLVASALSADDPSADKPERKSADIAPPTEKELGNQRMKFMRPVRTLSPDQIFAALDQSLSLKKGRGLSPRFTGEGQNLMARLDEARGSTPTEFKGGIPQALLLMNGPIVSKATTLEDSLTLRAVVEAPFLKDTEKLDTLFLAAYSRLPRANERDRFLKLIRDKPNDREAQRQAYANIFWALLNSPEFILCP